MLEDTWGATAAVGLPVKMAAAVVTIAWTVGAVTPREGPTAMRSRDFW